MYIYTHIYIYLHRSIGSLILILLKIITSELIPNHASKIPSTTQRITNDILQKIISGFETLCCTDNNMETVDYANDETNLYNEEIRFPPLITLRLGLLAIVCFEATFFLFNAARRLHTRRVMSFYATPFSLPPCLNSCIFRQAKWDIHALAEESEFKGHPRAKVIPPFYSSFSDHQRRNNPRISWWKVTDRWDDLLW